MSKFTFRVIESIYYSILVARVPVAWRGVAQSEPTVEISPGTEDEGNESTVFE